MSAPFAAVLRGLMANRHLGRQTLSRMSGRAESTINQLLAGTLQPTAEVLQDIAPALEMTVADLLVIAGLPMDYDLERPGPQWAIQEIGSLVAAATWLTPAQVEQLTALARELRTDNL
ncbi:helix-turn-helix domain-containing protein [Micromonospora avicenniae]|uniref:helix-turn-helix domain-containing protein n=1 Tax=Micromonospora avicenniae TaxID=1198245 RepID=UPI00343D5579